MAETTTQPEVTHSRRLLGTVSWLMKAVAVEWSDLDGIGVSLGPGSFTGLRIGMAAAKGLAMAAGVPLFGVETLDALALSCSSVAEQICPVLDARKQEVYAAMYQPGEDGYPLRLTGDQALAPELLADSIDRPTVLAGPAVAVYGELFRKNTLIRVVPAPLAHPRGLYVGLLACRMLATGQNMDPATATPKYVRASEAEITLRKKEGIE